MHPELADQSWQTRDGQNAVGATTCEFNLPRAFFAAPNVLSDTSGMGGWRNCCSRLGENLGDHMGNHRQHETTSALSCNDIAVSGAHEVIASQS